MPKLKTSERERQNRTLLAIIESGKTMTAIDTQTGIPPSTLYQRLSQPDNIRISELREILRVLKITDEEKAKIGREVI